MGEPRRWIIGISLCNEAQASPAISPAAPGGEGGLRGIPVRDDRATKADIEAVARREAQWDGLTYEQLLEGHRGIYKEKARVILAHVFGEEASRV